MRDLMTEADYTPRSNVFNRRDRRAAAELNERDDELDDYCDSLNEQVRKAKENATDANGGVA